MFCTKCGKEIDDDARFCSNCGSSTGYQNSQEFYQNKPQVSSEDKTSFWWALLGFLIPIVGLILYLIWKDEYPLRAKCCGKGALVSVILEILFGVLSIILGAIGFSLGWFYFL
ncbi:MAG: zinc-ribbon domain-containing protein [Clostridia bacterium]|nr:zinc-ribbon domain-containing protein [Clostridia bacterium]